MIHEAKLLHFSRLAAKLGLGERSPVLFFLIMTLGVGNLLVPVYQSPLEGTTSQPATSFATSFLFECFVLWTSVYGYLPSARLDVEVSTCTILPGCESLVMILRHIGN